MSCQAPRSAGRLDEEEILRYSRHLLLPDFGGAAQERLKAGKVLVVGAGGLGSPVLYYLAAAGVGTVGIVDDDLVDLTNLQRQIVHGTPDLDRAKVDSAAEKIHRLNPHVRVEAQRVRLDERNVLALVEPYDVVVDGVDNFPARYLLNDACVMTGKTLVEGGILRYYGLVTTIKGGESACYRCIFDAPPPPGAVPSCQEAGVLGAVAGVIGTLQATEVLKVLTGVGRPLYNRLLQFDALGMRFQEIEVGRRPSCPVCGVDPRITSIEAYELACDLHGGGGNGNH